MALNWKSLGQIALIIMVVMPIGLGYVMASETHEKTTYETSSSHNLSDYILNHKAPYYGDYTGSTNNHEIITYQLINGVWDITANSPSYAETSENPSSLPIETWTDKSYPVIIQVDEDYGRDDRNTTIGNDGDAYYHDQYASMRFTPRVQGSPSWDITLYDADHDQIYYDLQPQSVSLLKTGTTGDLINPHYIYKVVVVDSAGTTHTFNDVWYYSAGILQGFRVHVLAEHDTQVTLTDSEFIMSGLRAVYVKDKDTRTSVMHEVSFVHVTEDTIDVDGTLYDRATHDFWIIGDWGLDRVPYRVPSLTDLYGNPAKGWTLPDIGSPQSRVDYWSNNQVNRGVTMYATLDQGEVLGIMPADQVTMSADVALRVYRTATMMYVDTGYGTDATALGVYANCQIKITKDSYIVTGITAWPDMYGPISSLNFIEIPRVNHDFTMLKILHFNGSEIYWRCDSADIVMGEYMTTLNAVLNMDQIFPDKSVALSMNSVAIYGGSLTVMYTPQGGLDIPVDNGRITIGGQTFPLRGSLWMWTLDNGVYTLTINGYHLNEHTDSLASPQIRYNDEWSTIITGYTITAVTTTVTEWVPGVFAFDASNMAAAGMIAAVAAFVVLGLTGRASLPKAAFLAMICGGGVLILLLLT